MSKNYFIIFLEDQKVPEVGDIYQVSEVEIDFDAESKVKLAICYIEKIDENKKNETSRRV